MVEKKENVKTEKNSQIRKILEAVSSKLQFLQKELKH